MSHGALRDLHAIFNEDVQDAVAKAAKVTKLRDKCEGEHGLRFSFDSGITVRGKTEKCGEALKAHGFKATKVGDKNGQWERKTLKDVDYEAFYGALDKAMTATPKPKAESKDAPPMKPMKVKIKNGFMQMVKKGDKDEDRTVVEMYDLIGEERDEDDELKMLPADVRRKVEKVKEIAKWGDQLKASGLNITIGNSVTIVGNTFPVKDILKKFGFKFSSGAWISRTIHLDYHALYGELQKAMPAPKLPKPTLPDFSDAKGMTPDTRKNHLTRQQQIGRIENALEIAKKPADPDPEVHYEAHQEQVWYAVFDCTHNDVVARAVAAAKKFGGWGKDTILGAAKEREELNKKRAANIKKYGPPMESISYGVEELRGLLEMPAMSLGNVVSFGGSVNTPETPEELANRRRKEIYKAALKAAGPGSRPVDDEIPFTIWPDRTTRVGIYNKKTGIVDVRVNIDTLKAKVDE
jgi:hypothetical protein